MSFPETKNDALKEIEATTINEKCTKFLGLKGTRKGAFLFCEARHRLIVFLWRIAK